MRKALGEVHSGLEMIALLSLILTPLSCNIALFNIFLRLLASYDTDMHWTLAL